MDAHKQTILMLQQTSVRGVGPAVRDGKRRVQAVKREGSNHQRGIRIRQMVPESVIALRLLCGTCFYRAEPTDQFQLVELLSIVHGMHNLYSICVRSVFNPYSIRTQSVLFPEVNKCV